VGFTCEPDAEGVVRLRNGEPLRDALAALEGRQVDVVNIMHTEVEHIDACLEALQSHWSGAVGVYAHSSKSVNHRWIFDNTISPADYCTAARRWIDRGVSIIGGCCGIEPRHMEQLAKLIEK
jgi:S-methylmethionine-dependent homocysteine/selenocysteine methylase